MYSMLRKKQLLSQNEMSQHVPPRPGSSHVTHLEDEYGTTQSTAEVNANNDISIIYNCKDATSTEQKNTSLVTQSITNINIYSLSIIKQNIFNVVVATEIFLSTSLFGSISLTLANKDHQLESLPTSIPATGAINRRTR